MAPHVSVIVPVKDAAGTIRACLDSILRQELEPATVEFLMVDGGSSDGTDRIIEEKAASDPRMRLLRNPAGRVSPALNLGIREARGEIVVRLDAHAIYEPDYIRQGLALLEETGASAVGGIQEPVPGAETTMAAAIAVLQTSRFGLGGGAHRRSGYEGPADSLWLGIFPRRIARSLGGFDEALFRSEDNDFYARLRAKGGRLWVSSRLRARYVCRPTLAALARQYLVTGTEILPTLLRNRHALSPRHLAPGAALLGAGVLVVFSVIGGGAAAAARPLLLVLVTAYSTCLVIAALRAARGRTNLLGSLLLAFPTVHFVYGAGTAAGILKALFVRRRAPLPSPAFRAG